MTALAPADRNRLANILGMLGSSHAGERDAAALAADRLVRGYGLTWAAVLQQHGAACASCTPPPTWRGSYEDSAAVDLRTCGQHVDLLTPWEYVFVTDLAKRSSFRLSAKQRGILANIAIKVNAAGSKRR